MVFALEGKSAIVTGAGGGINLAYAQKLLEHGTNVLIADLKLLPEAEELIEKYKDKPKVVFQKTDVTVWSELEAMFKCALENFGSIDIVCPGAGIFEPPWSNFWYPPGNPQSKDEPTSNRYKLLDINLTHPIRTAQMAISHFLSSTPPAGPSNPKRLVFIASIAGEVAFLATPLYHASKFGVLGFMHSISSLDEYLGIRAVGVAPGIVKTRLWTDYEDKMQIVFDKVTNATQLDWIYPDEVADAMIAITRDDEVDNGKGEKIPIASGTMIEVAAKALRNVPMLGNQGPPIGSPGLVISNMEDAYKAIFGELQKPGWGQF